MSSSVGRVAFAPLATEAGLVLPVSFATLAWRYQGAYGLSVIIKASFCLDNTPMVAREPEPIYTRDQWHASGALKAPCDMVPRRPQVDVTLWAGAAEASANAALPNTGRFALMQGNTALFTRKVEGTRKVEAATGATTSFGGLAADHPSRRALLSAPPQLDDQQVMQLPNDMPWSYYQAAPPEQRIEALRGDAQVWVEGIHPDHPHIHTALPGVWSVGSVFGLNARDRRKGYALKLRPDTFVIDIERLIGSVVWRAEVALPNPSARADLTVVAGVATRAQPLTAPTRYKRPPPPARKKRDEAPLTPRSGAAAWAARVTKGSGRPPASATTPAKTTIEETFLSLPATNATLTAASRQRPNTLPFANGDGKGAKSIPNAAAWAAAFDAAEKGGTAAMVGGANQENPLPFAAGLAHKKSEQRRTELEAAYAKDKAEQEKRRLQKEADNAKNKEQQEASRKEAATEAARREEDERGRFEESQRVLRETEAKRAAEETKQQQQAAAAIKDDMYGGFDD